MLLSEYTLWSITAGVTITLLLVGYSRSISWNFRFAIYAIVFAGYQALIAFTKVDFFPFNAKSSIIALPLFLTLLIILYSIQSVHAFKTIKLSNSDIEDISDTPYVLGFCSTLAALILIFTKFTFTNEAPPSLQRFELIAQSATALITTFFGLIARIQLRGFSTKYQRYDLENEINKSLKTTLKLLRRISKAHEQFVANIDSTQSAINSHQEAMKEMSKASSETKNNYGAIDTHSQTIANQIKELDNNIIELLQKSEERIKRQDRAMTEWGSVLIQNARAIQTQATELLEKLKTTSNSIGNKINDIIKGMMR